MNNPTRRRKSRRFVYLPVPLWEWLDRTARHETETQGGAVRKGGAGVVVPSHVIERLIRDEVKRTGTILSPEVAHD